MSERYSADGHAVFSFVVEMQRMALVQPALSYEVRMASKSDGEIVFSFPNGIFGLLVIREPGYAFPSFNDEIRQNVYRGTLPAPQFRRAMLRSEGCL